jgi:hypothetical protein
MPKPLLPPRGNFISTRLIFHADIPAPMLITLIQLVALSWNSQNKMTCPLTYRALADLTSKSVRTIYGHLSALQNTYAALRLQSTGDGIFVVVLADWVFPTPKSGETDCKTLQMPVKEEEEDSILKPRRETPPPDDSDQEEECEGKPRRTAKFGKHKPLRRPNRALSAGLRQQILEAGVFPNLLEEIAASSYSEEDLRALLVWSKQGNPDSLAGLFIYRLPPCPACGMAGGKHKDDCGARYLLGPYAEFLKN